MSIEKQNGGRILIVDDDTDVLQAARLALKQNQYETVTLYDPNEIPEQLRKELYDTILLDMNFTRDMTSGQEGLDWLARILEIDSDAVVILITAFGDTETAVKAIKAGATDFIIKPWQNQKLLATVTAGIKLRQSRRHIQLLEKREKQLYADLDQPFHEIIGRSTQIQKVFELIDKVAQTEANILILGENGTGKELVARAIHRKSKRRDSIFCRIDLSTITDSLFESELFGHKKGSFTDAREDRAGRFEIATGGTLFLDEISNLPLSLQSKLLTAVENRQIARVGTNEPMEVDIRLICASNLSLQELVDTDRFREDLFYRINTVTIHIPPLRERVEDIILLAEHYLSVFSRKYQKFDRRLSTSAITSLTKHSWPGNVRELQHAIERAVILSDHSTLTENDFSFDITPDQKLSVAMNSYDLDLIEEKVIRKALIDSNGNVTKSSQLLGLTRTALYRRMKKYGL